MSRFTIYNASAGSGKTYTLAVQYIAKLLAWSDESLNAYQQILAVTFTNKATSEMKDRILQQLYGIGANLTASGDYLASVQQALREMGVQDTSQETIAKRSKEILHNILHDYSHFRVETIDSFFRGILSEMARELGLPNGLKTDIDQKRAISEAVDRIIDQLEQNDDVRRWITEFVREQMSDGEQWNVGSLLKEFALHIFDQPYLEKQQELTDFLSDDNSVKKLRDKLDECRDHIHAGIEEAIENIASVCPSPVKGEIPLPDLSFVSRGNYLADHLKALHAVTKGGAMPKIGATIEGWSKGDYTSMLYKKHTTEDEEAAKTLHKQLLDLLQFERFASRTLNSISLLRSNLNEMRLLNAVGRRVNEVTQEKGTFLLNNTPILLHRMVQADDASFIYEKTGSFLRHIMLDEFQDTSALQWSNFQTLLSENMAKGGTTLVVGDVKQSIYRWRGGDWSILANLDTEMQKYSPLKLPLTVNYRSTRHVVQFNNELYSNITGAVDQMCKEGEQWSIAPIYADVKQHVPHSCGNDGYVSVTRYTSGTIAEAHTKALREMCEVIRMLLSNNGCKASDIVILIRRKEKEMGEIAAAFAEMLPDVPLVSDEVFRLSQSPAINIIVNALRVILHPDDKASLDRLVYLYSHEVAKERDDVNLMFDDCDTHRLFTSMCSKLPKGFGDIEALHRMPIFELVMKLSEMFRVNTIQGQSAYLLTFYDYVSQAVADTSSSLSSLVAYWDEVLCNKSIPGGEVQGVNIMTIHRSKGLQWKTVLIPFCDWSIHDGYHHGSLIWSTPDDDSLMCGLPRTAIPLRSNAENSIFAPDYTRELQNQRVDNLNLLYVATTRAEDNLYIWGQGKATTSRGRPANPTMTLLVSDAIGNMDIGTSDTTDPTCTRYTYGTPILMPKRKSRKWDGNRLDLQYTTCDVDNSLYPALMDFRQSNDAARFTGCTDDEQRTAQQAVYINTGSVLHAIFAAIDKADDIDRRIASLPRSLVTASDGTDMSKKAKQLLDKGCSNKHVRDWFSGKYQLFNECNILTIGKDGRAKELRPDRVMLNGNDIVVVDFKFGSHRSEYRQQVQQYIALLNDMYPSHNVCGYLWYVYSNEVEKVPCNEQE